MAKTKKRKLSARQRANAGPPPQKKAKLGTIPNHSLSPAEKEKLFSDKSPFTEELARDDHDRERMLYKLLGSEDTEDRIRAANVIVSALLGGDGVPPSVLSRHLERRLFRGLASGNGAARVGFSYVLAEILGQLLGEEDLAAKKYPELSFGKVLGLLVEKTHAGGNIPGQEERDHFYGQLFGLKCFVLSGILFNDSTRWHAVLQLLIKLGQKKVWLKPQSASVIAQAIPQMSLRDIEETLQKVSEAGLAKTPEGIGIWLMAFDRFPDLKSPKPWKDHPLSSKYLQEVASVLRTSGQESPDPDDSRGGKIDPGNAITQLHFVWDLMINHFLEAEQGDVEKFKQFWDRVVDQNYFRQGSSDHQKLTGFKVFQKALGAASMPFILRAIFSKDLMTCLMNQASSTTPRLHRTAIQTLETVEKQVEGNPTLLTPILEQLLGENGAYNFDERVKGGSEDSHKTVERILQFTTPATSSAVIDVLRTRALSVLDRNNDQKPLRIYGEYIFRLASRPTRDAATSVKSMAFRELATLAYPASSSTYSNASEKTREACRKLLDSAAASLLKRPKDASCLCKTVLEISPDTTGMSDDLKPEALAALQRLRKLVDRENSPSDSRVFRGLAVLHAVSLLQLFNDPRPDALEVLHDAENCCGKLQDTPSGKDSEVAELLVEVLLSMLAAFTPLTRQASLQIFEPFTSYMSAHGLAFLTDNLEAEESLEGYNALFSNEGEDEEDMEDDFEEVEEQDEVDSEKDDGEDIPEGPNDLEAVLLKTFNISHTLDKDDEAESSDDDVDMSDSEMLARDEQLSGHLKLKLAKQGNKKERADAKKKVVEFKHRVLDLLEVYVKEEAVSANSLIFNLFPPLLQLGRTTKVASLSNKGFKLILEARKLLKKARAHKESINVNADEAIQLLEVVHDGAPLRTESKAYAAAASAASLSIASTLFVANKEHLKRVEEVYKRTKQRKAEIRASFFEDWHNWRSNVV